MPSARGPLAGRPPRTAVLPPRAPSAPALPGPWTASSRRPLDGAGAWAVPAAVVAGAAPAATDRPPAPGPPGAEPASAGGGAIAVAVDGACGPAARAPAHPARRAAPASGRR